jgi:hypothetical protein
MKSIVLYPPKGGEPINAHPGKVDELKSFGWSTEPKCKTKPVKAKLTKKEVNENG